MAVFISYSSKDQKSAEAICNAIENRGFPCWISSRDIGPGENFQTQIVRAIRNAKAMILVFSGNANNSEEIKKELVLAGQSRLVVIPVRVEDVAPDEAFAYEFATRQWIDVFQNWEHAIERVTRQIEAVTSAVDAMEALPPASRRGETAVPPRLAAPPPRTNPAIWAGVAVALLAMLGAGGWFVFGAHHSPPPTVSPASAPSAAAPTTPPPAPAVPAPASSASALPTAPTAPASAASASSIPTLPALKSADEVRSPSTPALPLAPSPSPAPSTSGAVNPFNAITQGVDAIKRQP